MIDSHDIDEAVTDFLGGLEFWDDDGVFAQKTLTYIAGALDMATAIERKIKEREEK